MDDSGSDDTDYERAKDAEGGLYPGRSDAPRRLWVKVLNAAGLLALGGVALALVP